MEELIIFEFGRHRMCPPDFSFFFERYAQEHWRKPPTALRKQLGSLVLAFHGYDQDERELHCIPEVRRFVQAFHAVWPYWLYFLNPHPGISTLPVLVACRVENLNVVQVEGSSVCRLEGDPEAIRQLLLADLPSFRQVADRAHLFPDRRRPHLAAVYALFGLVPDHVALMAAGVRDAKP
jgi:hypothetical protein